MRLLLPCAGWDALVVKAHLRRAAAWQADGALSKAWQVCL
jgi:hypothetical protein